MHRHPSSIFSSHSLFLVLALTLLAAPAFADGGNKLIGSWQAVSVTDGSGDTNELLVSFHKDKTLVSTPPSNGLSVAHGTWKKTGSRSFASTLIFFIFDADGNANLRATNNSDYEVGQDGQTYTSAFETRIETLDGTPVATVTGTSTGQRIDVE